MKIGIFLWSVLVIAIGIMPMVARANEELRYEPAPVRLSGKVTIVKFYGPPNYGEDPDTDSIEMSPILELDRPVDVIGDPNDELNSETFKGVTKMHLVLHSSQEVQQLAWHHVVVEGTLFQKETAHHRTDVLITVEKATIDDPR